MSYVYDAAFRHETYRPLQNLNHFETRVLERPYGWEIKIGCGAHMQPLELNREHIGTRIKFGSQVACPDALLDAQEKIDHTRSVIEQELAARLLGDYELSWWEPLDVPTSAQIALRKRIGSIGAAKRDEGIQWVVRAAVAMYDAFRSRLGPRGRIVSSDIASQTSGRNVESVLGAGAYADWSWPSPTDSDESNDDDDNPYVAHDGDRREVVFQQIKLRRGQRKFRDLLLERFEGRCVVTGCSVVDVLEAAHIDPYRGVEENNPKNGLLLRADVHTLFDLDLLGIDPTDLSILLHPQVAGEYETIVGKSLLCTVDARPSREALQRRFELFLMRGGRGA